MFAGKLFRVWPLIRSAQENSERIPAVETREDLSSLSNETSYNQLGYSQLSYNQLGYSQLSYNHLVYGELGYNLLIYNKLPIIMNKFLSFLCLKSMFST